MGTLIMCQHFFMSQILQCWLGGATYSSIKQCLDVTHQIDSEAAKHQSEISVTNYEVYEPYASVKYVSPVKMFFLEVFPWSKLNSCL